MARGQKRFKCTIVDHRIWQPSWKMIEPAEMGPPSDNPHKIWSKPVISKEKIVVCVITDVWMMTDTGHQGVAIVHFHHCWD